MKTLLTFALLAVLGSGSAFMLRNEPSSNGSAQLTDGAFRDGLYLGRLAAEGRSQRHVAVGRWATIQDRSSFIAGYQQGYSESLASHLTANTGAQD
jgi:hypothetical protein